MSRQLLRTLRQLDPDVIHIQQGHHTFNLLLGRLGDVPLVLTTHEVTGRRRPRMSTRRVQPQWPYTLGFRRADQVIVHGEALRPAVVAKGVDPSRVHVLPRAAPGLPLETGNSAEPTILLFGRLWPYKALEIYELAGAQKR